MNVLIEGDCPTQRQFGYMSRWRSSAVRPRRGKEIVVDLFCGGGGASLGIEAAVGVPVDEAINHSRDAIYYHEQNHPCTHHFRTDVFDVHPLAVSKGRPVGLLWLSPDCTHFSKSRGGKPKSRRIRSLATVGLWYAREVRPRIIMLENVAEFRTWCRLDKRTNQPDFRKKGECFHKFVRRLRQMGYVVEWRVLKACDYGAPTSRERLVLIARCDGKPIVWPKKTHGKGRNKKPYSTAADCIDFSIPTVSIFATKEECKAAGIRAVRPLADKTMERIFRGVRKFVINNPEPFIVTCNHSGQSFRGQNINDPFKTICSSRDAHGLVVPFLAKHYRGATGSKVIDPIGSITGIDHHSLVACHVEKMHGTSRGDDIAAPATAISAQGGHHALVTSHLMSYHSQQGKESRCYPHTQPLPTVDGSNRFAEVRAFLVKYYGCGTGQKLDAPLDTITGNDRFALVTVRGELYRIVDIGLRMLTPEELLRAQFGDYAGDYNITGLTKTAAVHMIGNSVCPDMARAVVAWNYKPLTFEQAAKIKRATEDAGVAA
jgi:DNA (cytosine-5)-methyltransferase 1